MLTDAHVNSMNNVARGAQSGWIHPRGRMALGSQLNNNWAAQIAELHAFNQLAKNAQGTHKYVLTQQTGYEPQGQYESIK